MNNLEKLKELTEKLPGIPKLSELVSERNAAMHSVIYQVESGTSFGFSLLNRKEVAVMELFVSKGTSWPEHVHIKENEWGIIYKGKIKVTLNGEEVILSSGNCVHFNKGVLHSSEALEDTWLISIAVPKIEGYPE